MGGNGNSDSLNDSLACYCNGSEIIIRMDWRYGNSGRARGRGTESDYYSIFQSQADREKKERQAERVKERKTRSVFSLVLIGDVYPEIGWEESAPMNTI